MHNNTQAKLGIKNLAEAKKYKRVGDVEKVAKDTDYCRNMVSLVYNMKEKKYHNRRSKLLWLYLNLIGEQAKD